MVTPEIKTVAVFLVAIRNCLSRDFVTAANKSLFEDYLTIANRDLVAIRLYVNAVISLICDRN